jgi:aromatic ring-cleaving dioxygenase
MSEASPRAGKILGWHCHIYFTPERRDHAVWMNDAIQDRFPIWDYRWLDKSNVLHPLPMFRFQFRPEDMSGFLEFVTLNRRDLSVLIHAITGNDIVDHSDNVMWMGEPLKLDFAKLEEFVEQGRNGGIPKELLAVNKTGKAPTTPGRRYRPGDDERARYATG